MFSIWRDDSQILGILGPLDLVRKTKSVHGTKCTKNRDKIAKNKIDIRWAKKTQHTQNYDYRGFTPPPLQICQKLHAFNWPCDRANGS